MATSSPIVNVEFSFWKVTGNEIKHRDPRFPVTIFNWITHTQCDNLTHTEYFYLTKKTANLNQCGYVSSHHHFIPFPKLNNGGCGGRSVVYHFVIFSQSFDNS